MYGTLEAECTNHIYGARESDLCMGPLKQSVLITSMPGSLTYVWDP